MRLRSAMLRLVTAALVLYAAWVALLFGAQEHLIFPGAFRESPPVDPPPFMRGELLQHPDGVRTEMWSMLPPGRRRPLLVYLHGNGGSIAHQTEAAELARTAGYALALPEYRGYGRSGGEPSERAITADLARAVDRLRAHPSVDERRVVYFGRSLGAGFAAQLARERPPAGLVLQTPVVRVDAHASRYLAPTFLVQHPFRTDRALARLDRPVLLLAHARDATAPPEGVARLARLARRPTLVSIDADHNDSGSPSEAERERRAILDFLADIAR